MAIEIKTFLGPEHSSVAESDANLGLDDAEAESMSQKVEEKVDGVLEFVKMSVAKLIEALGPEHIDVANCYVKLGGFYQSRGSLGEAMEAYKKSLIIQLKNFGPEHNDVAATYSDIGCVLDEQENLGEAMEMYKKSLAIYLKTLGREHPLVGDMKHLIVCLSEKQGAVEELERLRG
jgi:tetratricopeptide (TPR) repeat protein